MDAIWQLFLTEAMLFFRKNLDFVKLRQVFFQVDCTDRLAVRGVNSLRCDCDYRLPRLFVLLQVFDPDGDSLEAREVVHGGIATEENVVD